MRGNCNNQIQFTTDSVRAIEKLHPVRVGRGGLLLALRGQSHKWVGPPEAALRVRRV